MAAGAQPLNDELVLHILHLNKNIMPICLGGKKVDSYAVVDKNKDREEERDGLRKKKREAIALSSQTPQPSVTRWSCWWILLSLHSHSPASDWLVLQDDIVMSWNLVTRVAEPCHDNNLKIIIDWIE